MSGWYKQQRNRSERPWFKNAKAVQLYDYLKDVAYVQDGKYEDCIIRRGSCPTTRAQMMEATGQSYGEVRSSLNVLLRYGEIILRASNKFTIVTICDYDACDAYDGLFDGYGVQQMSNESLTEVQQESNCSLTPPINIKEERIYNNLISPYSPYKTERETRDVVLEIKKRYNKFFDGVLPPLLRLHLPIRNMVTECIRRFGLQSIDVVFEQVMQEKFSMGDNKTGFIASFQYIFEPANFQKYLERAQLRRQKKQQDPLQQKTVPSVFDNVPEQQPQPTKEERLESCHRRYLDMIALCEENPKSSCYTALLTAYQNGDLQKLGISWVPNQN